MAISSQIGIIDRTTYEGLTAAALGMWRAAVAGAERAGLARIVMTAGAGGGHASHGHGTEIDIVGYNADGSRWTPAQRVAVAAGAASAGANRFGFYSGGRGGNSLHVGLGYDGAPRNVAWGPGGRTGGVSVNAFNEVERDFVVALRNGEMETYLPTVGAGTPSGRSVDVRLTGGADFKSYLSSEDEAKDVAAAANRRAMLDAVAPAVRQVIERGGLIRVGVDGDAVRQLQAFLNQAGFTDAEGNALDEDAEFGRRTREALMAYQEARGVDVDGVLGPQTFGRMATDITGMDTGAAVVAPPVYTPSPPMQQAAEAAAGEGLGRRSEGEAVRELQTWLNFHGFVDSSGNTLALDADFGPRTEQALIAAQRAAGVPVTGRLDATTSSAFQTLDQHEANVTLPDVNATAPVDEALPPVAVAPVPDRTYEDIYDQPTVSDAQAAQYAAEKGMVTEPEFPRTGTAAPVTPVERGTLAPVPGPYVPPGWLPVPPARPVPTTQQWAANRPNLPLPGTPDVNSDEAAIYGAPDPTDAQRNQYQAERSMVTAPAPMVRSVPAPAGQAVLGWSIPVAAAPVGPLASPYPVRLAVSPTPIRTAGGGMMVGDTTGASIGRFPLSDLATMAAKAGGFRVNANRVEAVRAAGAEEEANAAFGIRQSAAGPYDGMTPAQMGQIDMRGMTPEQRTEWHDAFDAAMTRQADAERARIQAIRDARAAGGAPAAAEPAAVAAPGEVTDPYATMGRDELLRVDPSTLSREDWIRYDAALTRAANELKSSPDWLRDTLKRNGAPAERVANASVTDMIAMSTVPNKRIVPTGTVAAMPKPPKNTALDKIKLMTRRPTTPGTAAA
jgi:peptidoglycan hydrolase-like protein with peptidoglycan-binding domain